MNDPAERFIEAAVAPLGDNAELKITAELALRQAITAEVAEDAGVRVAKSDRGPLIRRWRPALTAVAFMGFGLILAAALHYLATIKPLIQILSAMGGSPVTGSTDYDHEAKLARELDQRKRLLLIGDPSQPTTSLRWKALWDSQPDNPAYFADYATAYLSEHKELPPAFLKTAGELDPENAWFPAIAASVLCSQSTREIPRSDEEKRAKAPKRHAITDPSKLADAMVLFRQVAGMKRFDSYQESLTVQRIRLLPPRTDWVDQLPPLVYVAAQRSSMIQIRQLAAGISAESGRLSSTGDLADLAALVSDWEAFVRMYASTADATLIDSLVKFLVVKSGYRSLATASTDLGLESENIRLNAISTAIDDLQSRRKALIGERGNFQNRASMLAAMSLPTVTRQALNAPDIRDEDLKPGRLAEHEFLGKGLSAAVAGSVGAFMIILMAYRFRGGFLRRTLSERLTFLLQAKDWWWIMGVGTLLPFLAFQIVIRLPLVGAREWAIKVSNFISPCAANGLYVWILILLPVLIARWRLGKRAGFLGLSWRPSWFGWGLACLLILAIPFAPQATLPWNLSEPVAIGYLLLSHAASWWAMVTAIRGLFSKQEHLLKRVTLSRAVLPAYALTLILTSLAAVAGYALERHWTQRDHLMEVSAEEPGMNRYEHRVMQAMQRELLEVLNMP